jgi:thiamine pyrophosphokinase
MHAPLVQSADGVTLVGGGPAPRRDLALALRRAPVLVAADGGADRALAAGHMPRAVIGDLDSLSEAARAGLPPGCIHHLSEQETTDFDKALRSIAAPFVLAVGFTGARADHGLAVWNTLARAPGPPCVVIGPDDVTFAAPPARSLTLPTRPGERVSLFPMAPVTGQSEGLEWPIDGLAFAPAGCIGTSNRATGARVALRFDAPGMLVILPRARLAAAIRALCPAGPPSARGG